MYITPIIILCIHSLSGNMFGDEGMLSLSSALEKCTSLQTLE